MIPRDLNNPICQDMVCRRQCDSLLWCCREWKAGRIPGWVMADMVQSYRMEAQAFGIWARVCARLIAEGFSVFADIRISEAGRVAYPREV